MYKIGLFYSLFLFTFIPRITAQFSCDPSLLLSEIEYQKATAFYPNCTPFFVKRIEKLASSSEVSACEPNPNFTEDECWYARLAYQIGEAAQNGNLDNFGCLDLLLAEVDKKFGDDSEIFAYLLNKRGVVAFYADEDSLSVVFYQQALTLRKKLQDEIGSDKMNHDIIRLYVNLANSYPYLKDFKAQNKYIKLAQNVFDNSDVRSSHPKLYIDFLSNAASYYHDLEDLDNAITYYQDLINYQQKEEYNCKKHVTTTAISARNQLALIYGTRLDRFEEAEQLAQESKKMLNELIIQKGGNLDKFALENLMNYALVLTAQKKYKKAITTNFKALQLAKESTDDQAAIYNNLGFLNIRMGNFSNAAKYLDKGMKLVLQDDLWWHYPSLHDNLSDVASHNRDQEKALDYNTQAILQLVPGSVAVKDIDFSALETFIDQPDFVIRLLHSRAKFQQLSKNHAIALYSYRQAAGLIERVRKNFRSDESKGILANRFTPVLTDAILNCVELYQENPKDEYAEAALLFSEQNRGLILYDAVSTSQATSLLPPELAEQDKEMQLLLMISEKNLGEEGEDASTAFREEVRQQRDALSNFRDKLKTDYPAYYNWVMASTIIDFDGLRQRLLPKKTYVEYFTTSTVTYAFVINGQGKVSLHKLPNTVPGLPNDSTGLTKTIKECVERIKNKKVNFSEPANRLYQSLISTLIPFFEHEELVIIPDKELAYLPFDVLPIPLTNPKEGEKKEFATNYLMEQRIISYQYSLALDGRDMPVFEKSANTFLGVAPNFTNSFSIGEDRFTPLLGTQKMVKELAKRYGKKSKLMMDHSKNQFLATVGKYKIVQIASHALADNTNGDNSYILFGTQSSDQLFAKEIYGSHMPNTEIVIISACQGALGSHKDGEGIISLGRSFFYAGAKAVMPTLWSVEESSTLKITRYFHKNIQDGQAKNHALNNARLQYLEDIRTSNDPTLSEEAHPYYWAAFIPIGNMDPIEKISTSWSDWILQSPWILLIFAMVAYLIFRNSKKVK